MEMQRRIITAPFLYPGFVCVKPEILGVGAAPKTIKACSLLRPVSVTVEQTQVVLSEGLFQGYFVEPSV